MKTPLVPITASFATANAGLAAMVVTAATSWEAACSAVVAVGAVGCALILSIRR
jgi:hypothetical protein